jgi:hypothetical protein
MTEFSVDAVRGRGVRCGGPRWQTSLRVGAALRQKITLVNGDSAPIALDLGGTAARMLREHGSPDGDAVAEWLGEVGIHGHRHGKNATDRH